MIGIFNDCYPPVIDGVSVTVQNYARWLNRKCNDVCVVTPSVPGAVYDDDFPVYDYFSVPIPMRRPYRMGMPMVDRAFLARLGKTDFSIVHAHSPFSSGRLALRLARQRGVPVVATFHSKYRADFERVIPNKAVVDYLVRGIVDFYAAADEVWIPQAGVEETLREYGYKGRVEVMDNGSDLVADYPEKYFADARSRLGIAPDEFVMLFVGQHIWEKNPRLIIEALSRIPDCRFRMYFVGNGYAASAMKELVSEKGLDSRVTFVGTITDRALLTGYYAASDLFLFPSLYDNAPLVVREAAALHTPSVMTRGATASSILTDGQDGFLVENDPDSMAALLRELISDPARVHRVGLQASKTLVRSWEDCVGEALDRYNVLLKSRGLPQLEKM